MAYSEKSNRLQTRSPRAIDGWDSVQVTICLLRPERNEPSSKLLIFLNVTAFSVPFCSRSFHPIRCDFVAAFWGRTCSLPAGPGSRAWFRCARRSFAPKSIAAGAPETSRTDVLPRGGPREIVKHRKALLQFRRSRPGPRLWSRVQFLIGRRLRVQNFTGSCDHFIPLSIVSLINVDCLTRVGRTGPARSFPPSLAKATIQPKFLLRL
jgi:hypothetical protein